MFGGPSFTPNDISDLTGRVVLVTGGSSGLGKESILAFARKGAKVYMAARSESKSAAAIGDIKSKVPDAKIEFLEIDLTSFESIKKAADGFLSKEPALHVLLNNAGVLALPYSTTKDGYEIQFGTNHMGHFLLTKLLQPMLIKSAESSSAGAVRIVNVSSLAHTGVKGINFNDMHNEYQSTWARYSMSKLANILHAKALSCRLKKHGIIVVSLHPGIINSPLWDKGASSGITGMLFWGIMRLFFTSTESGSYTQIYCAASPEVTLEDSGEYYAPVAKKGSGWNAPSRSAMDEDLAERLHEWSEAELKKHGY